MEYDKNLLLFSSHAAQLHKRVIKKRWRKVFWFNFDPTLNLNFWCKIESEMKIKLWKSSRKSRGMDSSCWQISKLSGTSYLLCFLDFSFSK
jgi:hypothetical protein